MPPPRRCFGLLLLVAWALAVSLWCPKPAAAQPLSGAAVSFEHLTTQDGLPENSVMAMLQDTLGFLWLGTQNGLVRYDGISMSHYLPDADTPHGIGGRTIRALYEDRQHDLWVGTQLNGLSHFDRATERFTTYRHDPDDPNSLRHNAVLFIHQDRAGHLWLLTGDGTHAYLNRLDPVTGTVTRYPHDPAAPGSLSHDVVTEHWISNKGFFAFLEDRGGTVWIGTQGGLNRYDRAADRFTHYRHDPKDPTSLSDDRIASIFEDRAGRLWVGTLGGGLNLMNRPAGTFTAFRHDPRDAASLSHDVAAVFFEDRSGGLWVTTPAGLDRFVPEAGRQASYGVAAPGMPAYNVVVPIREEDDGRLWLLASTSRPYDLSREEGAGGPFLLDPATGVSAWYPDDPADPNSFKGRLVSSYLTDRSGVFWLGSLHGGLNKVSAQGGQAFTQYAHDPRAPSTLQQNHVWSLYEAPTEPGVLWIGTLTGLERLDRATGQYTQFQPGDPGVQGPDVIFAIHEDRGGRLWLGTRLSGLVMMDRHTGQFTRYRQDPNNPDDPGMLGGGWVHAIHEDRAGRLWFGTEGVDRYDPETGTFTHFQHDPEDPTSLSSDRVEVLYQDRAETLWVGSDGGGVSRFDPETETFTSYRDVDGGPLSVQALYEDQTGRFWVGDGLTGLHLFDRETGTSTNYMAADGLPANAVFGIEEDARGQLWVNTSNGPARFDPEARTFVDFGLPTSGCIAKSAAGEILLCSQEGVIALHSHQPNPHPPQVALTGLRLFNEPLGVGPDSLLPAHVSVAPAVTLAHDQNDLTFEYAALHFLNPRRNVFRYKLDGYEGAWRDVGTQRAAIYPNLPPGDYTFRVAAANSDGLWNEAGAAIRVGIRPPWWQTAWAYLAYGLVFLGGVLAVDRVQRRRLIRQEQEKARIREARLQAQAAEEKAAVLAEIDQVKTRFFVNVSHEFRTPLTLILGPLHDALTGSLGEVDAALRPHLALMQRNGARLLQLINQLLDLSKLEAGSMTLRARRENLVPFLRRVVGVFTSRAQRSRITFEYRPEAPELFLYFEPDKLEKVFVNLLANAFKYTPEGGTIRVTVAPYAHGVEVVVADSGPGIPEEELPLVFDRFHQVDGSSTRAYEGTGIGLALVKELVALHGGTIRAESTVGQGTAFTVRLPQGTAHLDPAELEAVDEAPLAGLPDLAEGVEVGLEASLQWVDAMVQAEGSAAGRPDSPHVLIVEDHADVRAYLRSHLATAYQVEEAEDGEAGLAKARQHPPALVISDVMMPKMDGYELCRRIKADAALSHIPVILLTARADEESKVEGLETGADDYLYKPFSAAELLVRVENLIEIRRRLRHRYSREVVAVAPSEIEITSADAAFLAQLQHAVEAHLADRNFSVDWLADAVALSRRQLQRRVRALTGLSAAGYIRTMRLQRAADLLAQGGGTVAEVAYAVGFQKVPHFSKLFRQVFGVLPSQYPPQTP